MKFEICLLRNFLLFLNKSWNFISVSKIKFPHQNRILIKNEGCAPIYPNLIIEGDKIVRACDRHRNETATPRKRVTKYKHVQNWMVEFFSKSQSFCIKFARVNSIRMTKSVNLL